MSGFLLDDIVNSVDTSPSVGRHIFRRITESGESSVYSLSSTDCAVAIAHDSYDTVLLPAAAGQGGKAYVILRDTAGSITIRAAVGDTIDGRQEIRLDRRYARVSLMSDDVDQWVA